jgi:hypothetical protein
MADLSVMEIQHLPLEARASGSAPYSRGHSLALRACIHFLTARFGDNTRETSSRVFASCFVGMAYGKISSMAQRLL